MDIQEYINSGILEQYCLGLLSEDEQAMVIKAADKHPEIKKEIVEIEIALEKWAPVSAITPPEQLKRKILEAIEFSESVTLDNLPPTNKYSNYQAWLKAVEHLIPVEPFDDFFALPLRTDNAFEQTLVVTKLGVPKETHGDVIESFFILKGECVCTVGKHTYTLTAGDFLEIPLYEEHDVELLSPYVIAILQHQLI